MKSNFICEHCGAEIIEGPDERYIAGCEHYPLDELPKGKLASILDLLDKEEEKNGTKK